jgi:hypothetical protein
MGDKRLVHPLVGDPEDRGGVSHADPALGQGCGGLLGLFDSQAIGFARLLAGFARVLELEEEPRVHAWGKTVDQALARIREAAAL